MKEYQVKTIGIVRASEKGFAVEVDPQYRSGLKALEGFSHIQLLWWCHHCDFQEARELLETAKPYKNAPEVMGIFATRSPARPNPIALSTVYVLNIDHEKGVIEIPYTDAEDGTPVLDIKPYTPSMDRIAEPAVPAWCSHWPKSYEESGDFDWEAEMIYDK